jgi:TolB-like protein/class 3 adenylate cyclase/rhodanese-related sulfurtransferase
MDRRLSAILAADVVGYSALMERDEKGTHERLKAGRKELFEPEIALHHGRVFKLMGDGMLAEFGSVVDAVECAVNLQRGLAERNAAVPDDQRFQVRIGINLGEVIVEGDDRYGEGVNVAARLEQLAEPGGIWVSGKVAREVEKKLAFGFEAMGAQHVKNIAEPVQAYRVKLDGLPIQSRRSFRPRARRQAMIALAIAVIAAILVFPLQSWAPWQYGASVKPKLPLPGKPSLAVLPFADFGGDQGYFADGMTEDLITDLAKLSGIFVISRNSSWVYKEKPVKVQQVADELGVRYVLEGSVRREGDTVRINAQLIDAVGGQHLWADRYDGSMKDVFALQDKVIGQIVSALAVNLSSDERADVARVETKNPEAYDAMLQGWGHYRRDTEEETKAAIVLFEKAIELDPAYARAHAALAAAYWRICKSSWEAATQGGFIHYFNAMNAHLAEAFKQPVALAHAVSAEVLSRQGRYDEAFVELGRAMELAPSDPETLISKARILNATGKAPEAEEAVRVAMRLDPQFPPDYLRVLGLSQLHQGRYADALQTMRNVVNRQSDVAEDYATIAACLGLLGRTDGTAEAIKHFNDLTVPAGYSPITVQELSRWWWYGDIFDYHAPYLDRLEEGLRKAGVPEGAGDLTYPQYRAILHKAQGEYTVDGATKVDLMTAKAMRDRGVVFVDARAAKDFARGHIPGAVNLNVQTVLSRGTLAPIAAKDQEVVFSCHGKYCPDSAIASAKAVIWGYTHVYYFAGGYPAWKEAGYPVEASAGG